eukprot:2934445-Rhodomonas_salina.1
MLHDDDDDSDDDDDDDSDDDDDDDDDDDGDDDDGVCVCVWMCVCPRGPERERLCVRSPSMELLADFLDDPSPGREDTLPQGPGPAPFTFF